jgi:DNA-binding XRE family transcriptional regulator
MTTARKNNSKKTVKRRALKGALIPRTRQVVRAKRTAPEPEIGEELLDELAKGKFTEYKSRQNITPGFMVREFRELNGLTQSQLADATGLTQAAISAIESDTQTLGIDRVKVIARALHVHPGVLAFPNWDLEQETA